MASTKQISHETVNDSVSLIANAVDYAVIGQVFTVPASFTIDKMYFYLSSGSPLVVSCQIYTDYGLPHAPVDLVSSGSAVFPSTGWVEVSMTSYEFLEATYWIEIVLDSTGADIGTDNTDSYGQTTELSITNSPFSGDTYSGDLAFQLWGETSASPPTKATNPTPSDTATDIKKGTSQVSWEDGGGALTYDVYFGETGSVTLRSSAQAGLTWDIPFGELEYSTEYTWRIDSTNGDGTTTGDTWTFTIEDFDPPVPTGMNALKTLKRIVVAANDKIYYES